MGKKSRRLRTSKVDTLPDVPFVSVCTPTFNRRPFIPGLIRCFQSQTYDKSRMEWLVMDDGTDEVRDLFEGVECVRYIRVDSKMKLGAKRNALHSKCKGDVIVYMDDDDFYPPTRVSHAVATLKSNPAALCCGTSKMCTYFPTTGDTWVFGPYGDSHCTAASMAFRRSLLTRTSYDNDAVLAEEKHFLKNYTIPFVQLDSRKTIVVVAHAHNSFDKRELLKDGPNEFARQSHASADELFGQSWAKDFYGEEVHKLLMDYPQGAPSEKPDVEQQYSEMKAKREEAMRRAQDNMRTGVVVEENGQRREMSTDQILSTLRGQSEAIEALKARVQARDDLIATLQARLEQLSAAPESGSGCPEPDVEGAS